MPSRYYALLLSIAVFIASAWAALVTNSPWVSWPLIAISGFLSAVGLVDISQTKHAIRRNYPILSHFRFFFEYIRPEIRQYFIESDNEASPFSRASRSLVYQRAKKESDKRPFGTQLDVYEPGY
ncbi:MAG TPA: FMN-binding glutamate synthase family protein, partial [Casimicrobium sp.]|nr:FMN-binding glutamate synthase family protein [Casimicrobium sp.]